MTRRAALLLPVAFAAGLAAGLLAARRSPEPAPPAGPRTAARVTAAPAETPEPVVPVVETAGPRVVLSVLVSRPDGGAPAEAELSCRLRSSEEKPLLRTWRPDAPHVALPEGSFDIRAVAGADREFASGTARILLRAGEAPPPLTLTLAPLAGVRGRVVLPPTLLLRSVEVEAWTIGESPRRRLGTCQTTGAGRYAIAGLPPGPCLLAVQDLVSLEVAISEGMIETDLVVPDPAGEAITVRVQGPDGGPVFSAWVDVRSPADPEGLEKRHGSRDVHAGPGVRLLLQVGEDCDADAFLRVKTDGLGSRKVPLPPRGGAVTVRFAEPAWLRVEVKGLAGSEDLGYLFTLRLESTPESEAHEQDALDFELESPVVFGPLQPGPARLGLLLNERELASWPAVLASGRNELVVTAPPLHELVVQVPGRGAGDLTLRPAAGGECASWSDCDQGEGTCRFAGLPAGRYILELADGRKEDGRMEVEVPARGVVRFEAERCDALRVAELEAEGLLGRAGLRAGDLVLAVDGEEFDNVARGRALVELAATRETAELRLLRDSAPLTIRVPGAALATAEPATFEPAAR
ncbi:MAG: PDZ domain-containing protein [Planctomycetes bacterium]|nr:PDZ domain-containing protein [Planctomycetota bacterium]